MTDNNAIHIQIPRGRNWEVRGRMFDAGEMYWITPNFLEDNNVVLPHGTHILAGRENLPESRDDFVYSEEAKREEAPPDDKGRVVLHEDDAGRPLGWIKLRNDGRFDGYVYDATANTKQRRVVTNKERAEAEILLQAEIDSLKDPANPVA